MTKVTFEICEVLKDTQQFLVCFSNEHGDRCDLAVGFPKTDLSDADLLTYIAQFAPPSLNRKRPADDRFDHLVGRHEAEKPEPLSRAFRVFAE